jgi:hypothetical protein
MVAKKRHIRLEKQKIKRNVITVALRSIAEQRKMVIFW